MLGVLAGCGGADRAQTARDEGKGIVGAIEELITISENAGLPAEIFHLKVAYQPGWRVRMDSVRETVDAAGSTQRTRNL